MAIFDFTVSVPSVKVRPGFQVAVDFDGGWRVVAQNGTVVMGQLTAGHAEELLQALTRAATSELVTE